MSEAYLAAAVQMCSGESKEANLEAATRQVEKAAQLGARVVALPELFNCLGRTEVMLQEAEEIPGRSSEAMGSLARRLGIILIAGSICERDAGAGKVFNTCLLIDSSGQLQARYRKMHLFDIDLPGQISYQESSWLSPGDVAVTAPTPLGCFGLSICYDLRFPELYRGLVEAGAEVVMVPSAFTLATGRDHWQVLLRSRAIENQVFVIAPNQYGQSTPEFTAYGRSTIIDPWGTPLAVAPDGEAMILALIDPEQQREIRRRLPALDHRRHHLVAKTSGSISRS